MKKFLWIIFIVLLLILGFLYLVKHPELPISQNIFSLLQIEAPTDGDIQKNVYTIKTESRVDMPGEDILVHDEEGNVVLSLINDDPQYVFALVDNYLILDIGTSAGGRTIDIYDIPQKEKIFETGYYAGTSTPLFLNQNIIQFHAKVRTEYDGIETKPVNAPTCTGLDNGYIIAKYFDLTTKISSESGTLTCAYFE